jgi:serine/threonine protein kinase
MAGIAEGLSHMHDMGVMHRDIKMENIMFRSQDSLEPVIVDLGLAAVS